MSFGLPLMLLGLVGVAIPVIIHLLNRRRFDVVEWGAMQFLQISQTTRRRLLIEELLLLVLRMGLIAILVCALAAPFTTSPLLAGLGARDNRDVVLVFDGSYSMGYAQGGTTAHDAARAWAHALLDGLSAGDTVALLQAKQQVVPVLEPTHDWQRAREAIDSLPGPRGACDWPQAVQAALKLLDQARRPRRDVIVLTDGQRFGWADEASLLRWELLAQQLRGRPEPQPRVWVVSLDPHRPANPPNWAVAPLRPSRGVASVGQQVVFRTALELHGQQEYQPPYRLRLEVDERPAGDLKPPTAARLEKGQVPLSFSHRFTTPGSHLVSVIVEPDPPAGQRPPGYVLRDHLPGDNRQDFAVEVVPALPVLLVDGDTRPNPRRRGSDFLRDALAPARDPAPVVLTRVLPVQEFDAADLAADLGKEPGSRPRVLVLCDVPRLTPAQDEAVARFLAEGGGVLVTLGERAEAQHYNEQLYRGGQGWLPARLDEILGSEADLGRAASPLPGSFHHPALDLFREATAGGLAEARFPRWWKVTTPGRGSASVPVALLASNDPLLVERVTPSGSPATGRGRVLLATVPLDNSWRTNLTDLPAFAPLVHELIYYLAAARATEQNVAPGQPLRYRPANADGLVRLTLQPPGAPARPLEVGEPGRVDSSRDAGVYTARLSTEHGRPVLVYEDTRDPGVYRLTATDGQPVYYVVQPDARESDLAPCTPADRERVAQLVPHLAYAEDQETVLGAVSTEAASQELWGWFLAGVIGLLCGEVWLTRRMAQNRA